MNIPFALRRPWLLFGGARADRDQPDLAALGSITDPERFVWAILPHAARSFATSILLLPAAKALTAAVAYLYCRMLDTYEDLGLPEETGASLSAFAARMRTMAPPPKPPRAARDNRDRAHVLLIDRCELVDRVFATLPTSHQNQIITLVESMAAGMVWSAQRFAEQGGVLVDDEQLARYCHIVIGEPALFALALVEATELTPQLREDALASSELIQLANITRDIERDLERGIAYHPSLLPYLRHPGSDEAIGRARRRLMARALPQVSAYARLAGQLAQQRVGLARAPAITMLLHTDRHYRWCARRVGMPPWKGPDANVSIVAAALLAAVSRRWSDRVTRRVEHDFHAAAADLEQALLL
ncbi:MAG: squalene/phytoene synthase family protein [Acidimicrobiia bacterium]|nr:squalene/phytoene synthase family protein [Acidimicrobiia bacterium]